MKEIVTPKGSLKYRLPNIAEGMFFISLFEKIDTVRDVWSIRSKIISNAQELIDFKSIGYSSYGDLLNDKENMSSALKEISEIIYEDALDLLLKKN